MSSHARSGSLSAAAAAVVAVMLVWVACGAERAPERPLNVLLVTVDTLRADHLGAYGYPLETSPALDRLAAQGVLFETPFVQRGSTWPSLTSLLTGQYPQTHGVRRNGDQLDASHPILAQILRTAGYRTAAFLTNMTTAPNRGFDHKLAVRKGDGAAMRAAINWLEDHREEAFFLWIHLLGPHDPYVPKRLFRDLFDTGYRGPLSARREVLTRIYRERVALSEVELAHLVSLYDGAVAQTDYLVGELLDALRGLGLADRTLVVFTSDHGEELYDHHYYFLHAHSIYESVLRVPLLLRSPGLPAGHRVEGLVQGVDVVPTVLDLLGIAIPEHLEGRSLLPRVYGTVAPEGAVAYSELGPRIASIRTQRWHYILNSRDDRSPGPPGELFPIAAAELYDMTLDPAQRTNVVRQHPEVVASLRRALEGWRTEKHIAHPPRMLSPETKRELQALGYLE